MSQVTTPPPAPAPVAADAVRVVLFGMPDAGKSSLLGALAQAAQTQEHVLNGKLLDQTQTQQGLIELQRRLYEDRPRETLEEVVPYAVRLEPFPPRGSTAVPPPIDAVLFDCDGRVANELLTRNRGGGTMKADGALARAILEADTLVLVVDAAADPATLKRDFGQFAQFLRVLEQSRGQRSEVGGLPVYLVLSKCDLLAQPNDTSLSWVDRIEDRKRQVGRAFHDFLAQQAERENMPFGKIELNLWATAVKRPALTDTPAKQREPYGVAELFRQCLDAAGHFRERRVHAESRLKWTVGAIGAVVGAMLLFFAFLYFNRTAPEVDALATRARKVHSQLDSRPEKRFSGPLEERIKEREDIAQNKYFPQLPEDLRNAIIGALEEFTAYKDFRTRLGQAGAGFGRNPAQITNEDQLAKAKADLEKTAPPRSYEAPWGPTEAVGLWKTWLKEVNALDTAVKQTRDGYDRVLQDGKRVQAMWSQKRFDDAIARAKEVWKKAQALPTPKADATRIIEGDITYGQVFRFLSVEQAYQDWEKSPARTKVKSLVDLEP